MSNKIYKCITSILILCIFTQTAVGQVRTLSGTVAGDMSVDTGFNFAGYDYQLSFGILPDGGGPRQGCSMWAKKGGNDSNRISFVMSGLMAARLTGAHVSVQCDDSNYTATITLD